MSDGIPLKVSTSVKLKGHMSNGDYTQDFLEAGTVFKVSGTINVEGVPVTKAWVEGDVLYIEGKEYCE